MDSGLNLSYSEDQQAIRNAVDRFCQQQNVQDFARQTDAPLPRKLWRQLAELGVFSPAAPGHSDAGGALEVCAISEILGTNVFPGPIASTYLAIQVLGEEDATAVIDGKALVSLSNANDSLLPWGTEADIFLVAGDSYISRATAPQQIEPVTTLGGEIWGRASLSIEKTLQYTTRGLIMGNISSAAFLSSLAHKLLNETSEYAATRRQFGKTLGEFQAVAQPLADCAIGVIAAQNLARAAACSFDSAGPDCGLSQADRLAAGAAVSARRASLRTAFACHQVYAGIGVTLAGPAFYISRRIRQLASQAPAGPREQELLLAHAGLGR